MEKRRLISLRSVLLQYLVRTALACLLVAVGWLLVLMLASLVTLGHVTAALAMILFVAAPLSALSFWALAGVFTRSDVVRVLGGLLWASTGIMFGWYAQANMPMLTVMVFLPAAWACTIPKTRSSRAHPFRPRPSPHCASSLWWPLNRSCCSR